jgi:hypothetical protein
MSYNAKVFNVMIASPGDVASERSIIRDVVYEWNAVNSQSREIVLLPVGWESHSSPEMGASPQKIINGQILDKCDILIGVFWTRLGTPTDEYSSGTVEEIERHIQSEKPAMLYFSSQPVAMDSVDLEQIKLLQDFKKSCQKRGLYESYDSHSNFKEKFYRQLQLKVNEHPLFLAAQSNTTDAIVDSEIQIPTLSDKSRLLLKEASLDSQGNIMLINHIGGTNLYANGKNLILVQERREIAKWEAAVEELVNEELLVERGYKGEVFEITDLGYQIADMIQI